MNARLEPPISRVSEPYWDATRHKQLVLQRCRACDQFIWFPRVACPTCLQASLVWEPATGRGTVYAVSVQHAAGTPQMKDRVPFAVVLVDLDEGVRVMSNVIGCEPDGVEIGMAVSADWEPLSDGRHLLVFRPVDERSDDNGR